MVNKSRQVVFQDKGLQDFKTAWDHQSNLFDNIMKIKTANRSLPANQQNPTPNYLIFTGHPHVYTLGKSGSENNLLLNMDDLQTKNAKFYRIDRGGDITYHGPGQIIGYPILDLENFSLNLHKYVYNLEESIIRTLKHYNIESSRLDGASGVWLNPNDKYSIRKICAIGIKSSRWVTMHGFAFNVNTQLEYFDYINPCGFTDKSVSSMQKELGYEIDIDAVKNTLKYHIIDIFNMDLVDF